MAAMQMAMVGNAGMGAMALPAGVVPSEGEAFFQALAAQLAAGQGCDPALLTAQGTLANVVSGEGAEDEPQAVPGLDPMLWLAGMPLMVPMNPMTPAPTSASVTTAPSTDGDSELAVGLDASAASRPRGALPAALTGSASLRGDVQLQGPQVDAAAAGFADSGQDLPPRAALVAALGAPPGQLAGEINNALVPLAQTEVVTAVDPGASEALRALAAQRPVEAMARTSVVATVEAPVRSPAFVAEFGDRLVWAATRHAQVAEISLTPPQLGSVEVRLSMNGNEAGAQFYSPNASVREILEQALPRLKEIMAEAGIQLGQAQVNDHAFARRDPAPQQASGPAAGDADASLSALGADSSVATRVGLGLVDLYA